MLLWTAEANGHVDVAVLIQNGADVNAVEKEWTSLSQLRWTC